MHPSVKIAIFVSLLFFASPIIEAFAKTYNVKSPAGRSKVIGYHMLFQGRSCRGMIPGKAKVIKAPKHGKIRFVNGNWTFTKGRCKGYRVPYVDFVYTGNGKSDYVVIGVSGAKYVDDSGNKTWFYKYKINQ